MSTPGATGAASSTTQHAMGEANSGMNNAQAATNDAQSQAAQDVARQQPSASASVNGSASGNMK
jgi:hypothetical protein